MVRRLALAVVFMAAAAGSASAQSSETPPPSAEVEALYACAQIADDAARLACYDGATARMRQAQTEGRFVAVDRAQVETMQRESFGFSLPSIANLMPRLGGGDDAGLESVALEVERIYGRSDGHAVFVMTNGQRWEQVDTRSPRNIRPGDTVTVRRASLGSFMLVGTRGGTAHRVRRQE